MDERFLDLLACPRCRGDLDYDGERDILICRECGIYYEIRDGIPVLLPDAGMPLEEDTP
jgi:uncharacterized protein YbaR (Trm112 family)